MQRLHQRENPRPVMLYPELFKQLEAVRWNIPSR